MESQFFQKMNKNTLYVEVDSEEIALSLKKKATEELKRSGKNIVIIFGSKHHYYLAPGQDPYQFRKEIVIFKNKPKEEETKPTSAKSGTATTKHKRGLFKE